MFMDKNINKPPVLSDKIEKLPQAGINQIQEDVRVQPPRESPVNQNIVDTPSVTPSQETIPAETIEIEDGVDQLNYEILYKQHELLLNNLEIFIETHNQLSIFYGELSNYYYNVIPDDQKQYHITPLFNTNDVPVIEYEDVGLYFITDIETYDSLKLKHDELIEYNNDILTFYGQVLDHTGKLYDDYNAQARTPENIGTYLGGGALNTVQVNNDDELSVNIVDEVIDIISPNIHPDSKKGIITDIVDGDTLYFNGDKYRLALIDTYELDEEGGVNATSTLLQLCPVGSMAYMEDDSIQTFDKYERRLGVVWCEGNDYNIDSGEYLYNQGHLKRFLTTYCENTESATYEWAETSNNWFYYNVCN